MADDLPDAAMDRLRAENERMRAVLRDVEWCGERRDCTPMNERTCPSCFISWNEKGAHYRDCALAAALKEPRP